MGYSSTYLCTNAHLSWIPSSIYKAIYRVGDSITNPITPMMPYLPLLLSYAQKYDKNMKLGTLLSSLMPYSIALTIVWIAFTLIWFLLGIPVGPGGP